MAAFSPSPADRRSGLSHNGRKGCRPNGGRGSAHERRGRGSRRHGCCVESNGHSARLRVSICRSASCRPLFAAVPAPRFFARSPALPLLVGGIGRVTMQGSSACSVSGKRRNRAAMPRCDWGVGTAQTTRSATWTLPFGSLDDRTVGGCDADAVASLDRCNARIARSHLRRAYITFGSRISSPPNRHLRHPPSLHSV